MNTTNQTESTATFITVEEAFDLLNVEKMERDTAGEMKEFEKALEKDLIDTKPTVRESKNRTEKVQWVYKHDLLLEIQEKEITDVNHAKKWLEFIELVHEWAQDPQFDIEHRLSFSEGDIEIDSISKCCGGDWILGYENDVLYLDDEEFGETVSDILNFIESIL